MHRYRCTVQVQCADTGTIQCQVPDTSTTTLYRCWYTVQLQGIVTIHKYRKGNSVRVKYYPQIQYSVQVKVLYKVKILCKCTGRLVHCVVCRNRYGYTVQVTISMYRYKYVHFLTQVHCIGKDNKYRYVH
jgi:hypothetical protein